MESIPNPKQELSKSTTQHSRPLSEGSRGISEEVIAELSTEINHMISYAVHNGIIIHTEVNSLVQNSSVDDLINAHNLLCKNIAPATPKSISFMTMTLKNGKKKNLMNSLPQVRNLILLAIFFLVLFVSSAMSEQVSNDSLAKGILGNDGWQSFLNFIFIAAISGMGVLFFLLKNISSSLKNGALIPEDTVEYSTQIILGIISGIIMSEIMSGATVPPDAVNFLNKAGLALLGGFSSDAIFSILKSLVDKLKGIFITPKE